MEAFTAVVYLYQQYLAGKYYDSGTDYSINGGIL